MGQPDRAASWSVRAYAVVVLAYPSAFRREFGESMTQVFRDLAREAFRSSGAAGLARLWARTSVDVLVSLAAAYANERRESMFRVVVAAGILYVCALALAAGYGAIRFGQFYEPPAFSRFSTAEAVDEDALTAAYEQALTGEFGRYRTFTFGAGIALALLLGVAAALFGLWQKSLLHGAGAFLAGAVLTIAVFELMPAIWFPFDRYAVGFIWLMRGFPVAAGAWLLVTLVGRLGLARFTTA